MSVLKRTGGLLRGISRFLNDRPVVLHLDQVDVARLQVLLAVSVHLCVLESVQRRPMTQDQLFSSPNRLQSRPMTEEAPCIGGGVQAAVPRAVSCANLAYIAFVKGGVSLALPRHRQGGVVPGMRRQRARDLHLLRSARRE